MMSSIEPMTQAMLKTEEEGLFTWALIAIFIEAFLISLMDII